MNRIDQSVLSTMMRSGLSEVGTSRILGTGCRVPPVALYPGDICTHGELYILYLGINLEMAITSISSLVKRNGTLFSICRRVLMFTKVAFDISSLASGAKIGKGW